MRNWTALSRNTALWLGFALLAAGCERSAEPDAGTEHGSEGKFLGAKPTDHPAWFKESFLDLRDDVADAASNGRRVMIYVYQDGCPYCNKLVDHNFAQKDIFDTTRKHFDVIALNLWGDREITTLNGDRSSEKEFAKSLGVKYTPTLVFLDEQGEVALRLNGYFPPHNFRVALDFVANKKEKETSFRDYFAANTPKPPAGELNSEPFFAKPPHNLDRSSQPGSRPLAVFFEQAHCENCDLFHRETLKYPGVDELIAQTDVVQLDLWDDETQLVTPDGQTMTPRAWARALNIAFAPSMVFFDVNGKEVARSDAFLRGFHTMTLFHYVLNKGYETQPEFQRYLQARAEHLREQGIDVDIWK